MSDFQKQVVTWATDTFPAETTEGKLRHLFEEIQEAFAEAVTCAGREETADCGLITLNLAASLGVEITDIQPFFEMAMQLKLDINKTRTWAACEDGVVRHVKQEA